MADLVKADPFNDSAEDTLEEEELEILRETGLIARPTGKKGRKVKSKKHIVFTEEGDGTSRFYTFLNRISTLR